MTARFSDVLVVGAGVMGAWTALSLRAGGRDGVLEAAARVRHRARSGEAPRALPGRPSVTLLDAWGAGNARATSGDETRISRAAHGADELYTRWSRASREVWISFAEAAGEPLWVPSGVLWFARAEESFEAASQRTLERVGVPHERLDVDALVARWPQIGTGGDLAWALYEPEGGALMARRGCALVARAFAVAGGNYGIAAVRTGNAAGGRLLEVVDEAGATWSAEQFVFACGPWLPRLFPDVLGGMIRVTKQDVVFVGPPAGDARFGAETLPAWCDYEAAYYGIPDIEERGFKLAPDRYGPLFDPSRGDRVVDADSVRLARAYLGERFPALAASPIVETRVCQYETTADTDFVIDRHPAFDNVWLVGGGSGHAFKHGPRIGEYVAARVRGSLESDQEAPEEARFKIAPRTSRPGVRTGGDEMANRWSLF